VGRAGLAPVMAAVTGLLLLCAAEALAHPFGAPPTARIWAEETHVWIDWGSAPDDAIVIGVELGLLPEEAVDAYLDEGPVRVAPSAEKEQRLSESDLLADYVLERITVTQNRRPCSPALEPIENFVTRGATVAFRCPEPVREVEIRIAMLHEVHEAYRTFAFSHGEASPAQAVFTVASPTHTWTFGDRNEDSAAGRGWAAGLIALGGLAIIGVVMAETLLSRRRRDEEPA
jgi:hypothetical protein